MASPGCLQGLEVVFMFVLSPRWDSSLCLSRCPLFSAFTDHQELLCNCAYVLGQNIKNAVRLLKKHQRYQVPQLS